MKFSTRGRYALRVIVDLAEHRNGNFIPLHDVATRQGISQKYLESIMLDLSKGGIVEGLHGKGGGYRLKREPSEYTVGEILRIAEGEFAPISCLEEGAEPCDRAAECKTLPMWRKFYEITNEYFNGITIADLMKQTAGNNYVI